MEEAEIRVRKHNLVLVCGLDAFRIHDTSTRCREIANTATLRPVDVVWEWEERIAAARHAIELRQPIVPLLLAERLGYALEQRLPRCALATNKDFSTDEQVDCVGLVRALGAFLEGQREDARVVAKPPEVGFTAGKTGAVNTRLLSRAKTDD